MKDSKKPGEPLETEGRERLKSETFIQKRPIYLEYQSIRSIMRSIQVVQIIQGAALVIIAAKLLLK